MRKAVSLRFSISIALFLVTLVLAGCNSESNPTGPEGTDTGLHVSTLMCGRSVMQGWFDHWGSDGSKAVTYGSFLLYYGALWSPPDIIDSVQWQLNNVVTGNDWILFFKLCFVDFNGSSQAGAAENYDRNIGYLNSVYDLVVTQRGLKVIFGTALPKVSAYTTDELVWNHSLYNAWIKSFAASHPGEVYVFDMYEVLADSDGSLRTDYAVSPTDSHLNASAYAALDSAFFAMLDQLDLSDISSSKKNINTRRIKPPLRQ
jgi:hypothetical protein